MTVVKRLFLAVVVCVTAPIVGTAAYLYAHEEPEPLPRVAAIIVLSGPGSREGVPVGQTRRRVERGVALWNDGVAPVLVMSGGGATLKLTESPDSRAMRALAESHGIPESAVVEEPSSHSTLQNALFTADLPEIDPEAPVAIVTHRYHLPRAWASFRWAGFRDIALVAADTERPRVTSDVLAEGIKWPLNVLRAAGASAAVRAGIDKAAVRPWLE